MSFEQWSQTDISGLLTISGTRNQIATDSTGNGSVFGLVRGIMSAHGDLYFESIQSSVFGISSGFATSSAPTNDAVGGGATAGNSVGTYNNNGVLFNGVSDNIGTYAGGDQLAHAISQSLALYWWKDLTAAGAWQPSGDPNTRTGGFSISGNITTMPIFPAASILNQNDTNTGFWAAKDIIGTVPVRFHLFPPTVFRKTFSPLGTRAGSRQVVVG